jgi:RNA polymerase sigma-70 factor (ECF subfamily)
MNQSGPFFRHLMESENRIYAFILAIVHNDADAKDIMQETLVIMWQQFSQFRPDFSFTAWGIGIAKNITYAYLRKHRSSKMVFSTELLEDLAKVTAETARKNDRWIDLLRECLGKLNKDELDLIKKRYVDNTTTKNIALGLGVSGHKMYYTMARIHRALQFCIHQSSLYKGEV